MAKKNKKTKNEVSLISKLLFGLKNILLEMEQQKKNILKGCFK